MKNVYALDPNSKQSKSWKITFVNSSLRADTLTIFYEGTYQQAASTARIYSERHHMAPESVILREVQ